MISLISLIILCKNWFSVVIHFSSHARHCRAAVEDLNSHYSLWTDVHDVFVIPYAVLNEQLVDSRPEQERLFIDHSFRHPVPYVAGAIVTICLYPLLSYSACKRTLLFH